MAGKDPDARPVRILIADDHAMFRDGLRRVLQAESDFQVVGEAGDGAEAVTLTSELNPDVVLLDLSMPKLPGLEALRALAGLHETRILMLTAAIERTEIVTALELGARGIVLKAWASDVLFKAIRGVMAGEYWVGRESVADLVDALRSVSPPAAAPEAAQDRRFGLTPREMEIVMAVVAGHTNKEIAARLALSEDTVKHHLTNVFDKTGVSNRLELALFAIHHGLTAAPSPRSS